MNATEKLGIGIFKTSEQLARKLEAENKAEIAARVREISRNRASAQSIVLRNRLREELNWQEQREIRKALAWTWVERVFDKDMTPEEKAIAEVWAIIPGAAWMTQNLGMIEKLWKSASDSFWVAWNLFKEWKFMAAIAVFFKWIFWKFSLDEWNKKPWEENGENKPENESQNNENFYAWELSKMRWFIEYNYSWDDKWELLNIAQKENFKKLSLKEINESYQNDNKINDWIKKTYWENEKPNIEKVKKLFEIFSQNWKENETLKRLLWNKYNIDLKISDILKLIWKDLSIFEHISSLNPSDIMTQWSEVTRFDISDFNDTWNPPKIFEEAWITKNLWAFILTWANYKVWDNKETLLSDTKLTEKEKEKIRKIMDFWEKIQNEIIWNEKINLWMWEKLKDTFSKQPLTLIEISKLYVILWWETNFDNMNEFKQSYIYFSIWWLLDNNRDNWKQWEYIIKLTDLIIEWMQWKTEKIPKWVTEFLWKIGNWMVSYIWGKLQEWSLTTAWAFTEATKKYPLLLPVIMLVIMLYPFAQRKTILWAILPKFSK